MLLYELHLCVEVALVSSNMSNWQQAKPMVIGAPQSLHTTGSPSCIAMLFLCYGREVNVPAQVGITGRQPGMLTEAPT